MKANEFQSLKCKNRQTWTSCIRSVVVVETYRSFLAATSEWLRQKIKSLGQVAVRCSWVSQLGTAAGCGAFCAVAGFAAGNAEGMHRAAASFGKQPENLEQSNRLLFFKSGS